MDREEILKRVEQIQSYVRQYPDVERHVVVADSDDWDDMEAALRAIEELHQAIYECVYGESIDNQWRVYMRLMMEVIYVKGYRRGLNETGIQGVGPF